MLTEEFLSNNVLSLIVLVICILGSVGLMIYNRRREKGKHATLVHISQLVMWALCVVILGDFTEQGIVYFHWRFITADTVAMICTTLIVLLLIRKLFLMINRLAQAQIARGSDITSAHIISRVLKILIVIVVFLLYGEHFGMSLSGLMTFGGIGGIAIGMAGKDILSNLFSGIMLYFDRPFKIGDWVSSPDRQIEGTVVEIGWRITKIITFDHRPLYIPNSLFSSISVENPGRMTNRRIKTTIGLRYEDADKIAPVVSDIRAMLKADATIDQHQTMLVYFDEFGDSALNIMVYCFTKTTVWADWLAAQQAVYLKIITIVHQHGADFAFPSRTLYMERNSAPASREPAGM
ncbi:mechanosensitive ion channel family protein [Morganella psychrotolerans]|uniref:Mechanosensitive ion channel protein MscS n=1 Tax=Morganella psychrotolerans TaxID=368603 RepID=A0A1B8HLV6_9GAMM|nr:mechanosensitive ion channel family protein [Morganella psychrotolerans]OBU10369.1 mechanosensitive ion channel protein MscS [Morganella psychrotolerans]